MEKNERLGKGKKVAAVTFLTASVAFIASIYLFSEDDIFSDVDTKRDLHKVWMEYNRQNHPDKNLNLEGYDFMKHMEKYHQIKERYEKLKLELT